MKQRFDEHGIEIPYPHQQMVITQPRRSPAWRRSQLSAARYQAGAHCLAGSTDPDAVAREAAQP